ncbi:PocR ligand-binding domain-containing protein [Crassaminicella profunda]|uniref:sensor histidine kinase n=1 Tax=Crassaminicella profunda TaxID=1286698 RepID=UPI001CA6F718|nr:PocR ligand-binding domain-containing protein [Crassaminicella profunda]QZY55376.1 PocR ligand-binding domain-containing protein [Crassaminicella profunda]
MKYTFTDLIDLKQFQRLMESFYNISKVPYTLLDLDGNILSSIGWQDICTKFHRINPKSASRCKKSDLSIKDRFNPVEKYGIYQCENGLMDAFIPVIVKDEHIATLVLGQFFLSHPDIAYFRKQAQTFNFDESAYLKSLSRVPIITKEQLQSYIDYYVQISTILSSMISKELKKRESESLLKNHNANLEKIVTSRTAQLTAMNIKLEEDIQKRKSIEKNLKESEERYRLLIDLCPYGISVRNKDTILFANTTAAKYFGFENPKEIIGKKMHELFVPHPDYRPSFKENLKKIDRTGSIDLTEEKFIRTIDGNTLYMETVSSFIPYNENTEILVVFRDISERKKIVNLQKEVEEKEKRLKETIEFDLLRTEFFANLSHEIKTPINLISSVVQLLELEMKNNEIFLDTSMYQRLNILKQNSNRLLKLTNNLIDVTKIDSGYLKLNLQNCNIISVIENITMSVAEYIKNNHIELLFDTNTEELITAVDLNAIERILLNLLSNAVKFIKENGKIMVHMDASEKEIILSVKDTGVGIPKDKLELIFDPFRQVDKSLTRNHEGSGMGLSLVKSLVHMHGGKIIAKSEYGQGSEFIITLPVKKIPVHGDTIKNYDLDYSKATHTEIINIEFSDIYSS